MKYQLTILSFFVATLFSACNKADEVKKRATPNNVSKPLDFSWVGKWEDKTGYWITIERSNDEYKVVRSGGPTTIIIESVSENPYELVYVEKGNGSHYRHTLSYVSNGKISDEWFDLDSNEVWQTEFLERSVAKQ